MIKNCKVCNKKYITYYSRIKIGKGKYCSKKCCFESLKGRLSHLKGVKLNEKRKAKLNMKGLELGRGWNKGIKTGVHHDKQFKKGNKPWNKNMKGFGTWKKWNPKDDVNPAWKGDLVKYGGLHDWIRSKLGAPLECTICEKKSGGSRMFHWHNISGDYLRDLSDWIRVCAKCHKRLHKKL